MKHCFLGIVLIVLMITMVSATGCSTIQGVGKDIQRAGEVLEDAAN